MILNKIAFLLRHCHFFKSDEVILMILKGGVKMLKISFIWSGIHTHKGIVWHLNFAGSRVYLSFAIQYLLQTL